MEKKTELPSVTNSEYLSDVRHSSEFYYLNYPIIKHEEANNNVNLLFSQEDTLKNKVKNFTTFVGIQAEFDNYLYVIGVMGKSIEIEHACEAFYIFNKISESIPTFTEYHSEQFSRDSKKLSDFYNIVQTTYEESKDLITKNNERSSTKTNNDLNKKQKDMCSLIRYIVKIMSIKKK